MADSDLLTPIEARVTDILANGRGQDGSLGADALARSIPAAFFRVADEHADLRDPGMDAATFDRAFRLEWSGSRDDPATNNSQQSILIETYTLRLTVGYLYGASANALLSPTATETRATAALRWIPRALSDGRNFGRALEQPELFRGAPTIDPVPVGATRITSDIIDMGGGRGLCVSTFDIVIQSNQDSGYLP